MRDRYDVVVVGGGLAGLAAAASARQAGASAVVLEAHPPGGRARVTQRDGFVFNHGAHALYRGGPAERVLASLGVEVTGAAPPLGRYRLADAEGRLHLFPYGAGSLLRTTACSRRGRLRLARLLAALPKMRPVDLADTSVSDFVSKLAGDESCARVLGALVRIGTYADDFEAISADAAVTQLQLATAHGVRYLDGGWQPLVDSLAGLSEVVKSHVAEVEAVAAGFEVRTDGGLYFARSVVVATGRPAGAAALVPGGGSWGDLGPEVTAACLDVGVRRPPSPGYVLGLDPPVYTTTQAPPARMAPEGMAVVASIRYGARAAAEDRADLEANLALAGVRPDDVVTSRFLARMVVAGAAPRADLGGMAGRPGVDSSGVPGMYVAGDWVGPEGLLADAALASGRAAGLRAAGVRTADAAAA